eukprot:CCRYP_006979-RE/>CCRYP_006979-RE protein AED:0.46 eAED:0.45 QI:0/0.75/0.6/1/0.75/0.6/5/1020/107
MPLVNNHFFKYLSHKIPVVISSTSIDFSHQSLRLRPTFASTCLSPDAFSLQSALICQVGTYRCSSVNHLAPGKAKTGTWGMWLDREQNCLNFRFISLTNYCFETKEC